MGFTTVLTEAEHLRHLEHLEVALQEADRIVSGDSAEVAASRAQAGPGLLGQLTVGRVEGASAIEQTLVRQLRRFVPSYGPALAVEGGPAPLDRIHPLVDAKPQHERPQDGYEASADATGGLESSRGFMLDAHLTVSALAMLPCGGPGARDHSLQAILGR